MEGMLACSLGDGFVIGAAAIVGNAVEKQDEEETEMPWLINDGPVIIYEGTIRDFLVLHPTCLTKVLEQIMRDEGSAAIIISLGPVSLLREALEV